MAGYPVVHGVHLLLWSLNSLFHLRPDLPSLRLISVRFAKMAHVGERVRLTVAVGSRADLRLTIAGVEIMSVGLSFEEQDPIPDLQVDGPILDPIAPRVLMFEQAAVDQGHVPIQEHVGSVTNLFPAASAKLGSIQVTWLARTSFLIGMVCPGLHSIFSRLDIAAKPPGVPDQALRYRVTRAHKRFQLLQIAVAGGGWAGSLEAFVRAKPAAQASLTEIGKKITPKEFAGSHALIVGGSRGLGEVAAKILAAGGAHVSITYSRGGAEADNIQREIVDAGGTCDVLHYDALVEAGPQLHGLSVHPNQLFYFATPPIFRRKMSGFDARRFEDFANFYVNGFYNVCAALRSRGSLDFVAFYPSSVSVETRPSNMTEYTMAKAAGEVLCSDMQQFDNFGPIIVSRLPRLQTDQAATLSNIRAADPVDTLLPIVRRVHAETSVSATGAAV